MDIKNLFSPNYDNKLKYTGVSGFFCAYGDFGIVDGIDTDVDKMIKTENGYSFENDSFKAACNFTDYENGVVYRADTFTAKKDLTLTRYCSRFCLEGGDYEVYTQSSCWFTESTGGWQPLVTGVEASNVGIRTTEGATPMLAIKNKGNGKILVLHLMPKGAWKIKASKHVGLNKNYDVIIETGINDHGLNMKIKKGESIEMPPLFVFEAENERDLDAWKLHRVFNKLYPRKTLPIIYNNWLNRYDYIDVEDIKRQADTAAELGVEQFLIDAGWYGKSEEWEQEVGEWQENLVGGYKGRVKEVSDYVRSLGMKFGMWLEPERAIMTTDAYKAHPEYHIVGSNGVAFLDFANPDAREYMLNITCSLIEKYNLEYMKFDFNASLEYDVTGNGFYRYFEGSRQFVKQIKKRYPNLYITNCASGGNRMDLSSAAIYDSVWPSDNQSHIDVLRIFKDSALRLPPSYIEKYDVRRFFKGLPKYGVKNLVDLPISGASWEVIHNVTSRYSHAFLTGGPLGFSTDIAGYPDYEKQALKESVAQYKIDREFYKTAELRILHDAASVTALQYNDEKFNRIIIQTFTTVMNQERVTVYPKLDSNKNYTYGDKKLSGNELMQNGITLNLEDVDCVTIELKAV